MAGIYIHIPFCRQACHYCDFHFSVKQDTKTQMVDAIISEMLLNRGYTDNEEIRTIYFGGGTPSLLDHSELARILEQVYKQFPVATDAEITLEANPDDLTKMKITELKNLPFNRLSIGVQSFNNTDLIWMNRAHDASQAAGSVKAAQDAGFHNISIDLIYGLPETGGETWEINMQKALDLQVQHLSCYSLTVEPRTTLAHLISTAKCKPLDEELAAQQLVSLMEKMKTVKWKHYEVSNFAIDDQHISRHNSAYWSGEKYLGFGPSAHSFNGYSRQWNISNNHLYLRSIKKGSLPFEKEILTSTQRVNEQIMTLLRTSWGLNLSSFEPAVSKLITERSKKSIDAGWAILDGQQLMLTESGLLIADRIILDLMMEEEKMQIPKLLM